MKLNEFLKDLIKKTDIDITNIDTAALIGASALKDIEVPETFIDQFYKGIYTKESALNDPEIKKKYLGSAKGEIYDGVDRSINHILREIGLGDELIAEIDKKSVHSDGGYVDTKKKLLNFGDELKKIVAKSKEVDPKLKQSDEEVRKAQEALVNEIRALKQSHQSELENIKTQAKNDRITGTLRGKILSYNFTDMRDEDKLDVANAKIHKLMSSYSIDLDETGGLSLRSKEDPRMEVYDERKNKLTVDDMLNSELSAFVKKSDTSKNPDVLKQASPFSVQTKPSSLVDMGAQRARDSANAELSKMLAS